MNFSSKTLYRFALVATAINVIGLGFATWPIHGSVHVILAVAFGSWAYQLSHRRTNDDQTSAHAADSLAALEDEVSRMREELVETQERLDFTERMLTQQRSEPRPKD